MHPILAIWVVLTGVTLGLSFCGLQVLAKLRPHQPWRRTDKSQLFPKALRSVAKVYCSVGTMPNWVLNNSASGMFLLCVNGAQLVVGPDKHTKILSHFIVDQPSFFMDVFCVVSGEVSSLNVFSFAQLSLTGENSSLPPFIRATSVQPPSAVAGLSGLSMSPRGSTRIISQCVCNQMNSAYYSRDYKSSKLRWRHLTVDEACTKLTMTVKHNWSTWACD